MATDAMTQEQYDELDYEGKALARCFVPVNLLPVKAIHDMRSLSIQGASLARQIIDLAQHEHVNPSVLRQAEMFNDYYEGRR